MKYFLDTEFLEGVQKEKFPFSLFIKQTKPTIDLISIGIVAEDGREYYAISKDFNLRDAWNRYDEKVNMDYKPTFGGGSDGHYNPMYIKEYWIRENVLLSIYNEFVHGDERNMIPFSYTSMKYILRMYGKSNAQIAKEVKEFVYNQSDEDRYNGTYKNQPEFYGYFCDYDWVVFAWLFGKMINLPNGFPKYCRDLKQMLDEKDNPHIVMQKEGADQQMKVIRYLGDCYRIRVINPGSTDQRVGVVYDIQKDDVKTVVQGDWKTHPNYPKQTNEHNALADAKWNKKLYEFLNNL